MIAVTDNDIICKLIAGDLLDELLTVIGTQEVQVLQSARFRVGGSAKKKHREAAVARYGQQGFEKIVAFLDKAPVIGPAHLEDADLLQGPGLDEGEVALISAVSRSTDDLLLTGDKRCLTTLVADDRFSLIVTRLTNRVICLESATLKLIETKGFDWVRDRLVPVVGMDMTIRAAFGSGKMATQSNAEAALKAYLPDIGAMLRQL